MKLANPQGRMDWLAATLFERFITERGSPLMRRMYEEFREDFERELTRQIGPKNKMARQITKAVRTVSRISNAQEGVA